MKKNELPKEVNDYMDEYIKTHTIKNMEFIHLHKNMLKL